MKLGPTEGSDLIFLQKGCLLQHFKIALVLIFFEYEHKYHYILVLLMKSHVGRYHLSGGLIHKCNGRSKNSFQAYIFIINCTFYTHDTTMSSLNFPP